MGKQIKGFTLTFKEDEDKLLKKKIKKEFSKKNKRKGKNKKTKLSEKLKGLSDNINFDDLPDDDTASVILKREKNKKLIKNKDNNKDSADMYEKRFGNELVLLYKILDQNISFENDSKDFLEKLKKAGFRNGKLITDMYSNVNSNKKLVLDILKEINGLKRTISDLEIKKMRADGTGAKGKEAVKENDTQASDKIITEIYSKIQDSIVKNTDFIDDITSNVEYSEDGFSIDKELEGRISEMEKNGSISFTNEERNFKYSNTKVNIYIIKNDDTGDWKLTAMDNNDIILDDYILPSKTTLGDVTFYDNESYAEDQYGIKYNLITVDTIGYENY